MIYRGMYYLIYAAVSLLFIGKWLVKKPLITSCWYLKEAVIHLAVCLLLWFVPVPEGRYFAQFLVVFAETLILCVRYSKDNNFRIMLLSLSGAGLLSVMLSGCYQMISQSLFRMSVFSEEEVSSWRLVTEFYIVLNLIAVTAAVKRQRVNVSYGTFFLSFAVILSLITWDYLMWEIKGQSGALLYLPLEAVLNNLLMMIMVICGIIIHEVDVMKKKEDSERIHSRNLEMNYQMMKEAYEKQQILIHDFRHHLAVIESMVGSESVRKIEPYLTELMQKEEWRSTRLSETMSLNLLLLSLRRRCEEYGVRLELDIAEEAGWFLSDTDTVSIMANAFDNAWEAARWTKDGYIDVYLRTRMMAGKERLIVRIENTCCEPPLVTDHGQWISRKRHGKLHGIGILSIQKALQAYHGEMKMEYFPEKEAVRTVVTAERR